MEQPSFDLEKVYDEEVAPLMTKIIEICKQHKLPMFATFLYANDLESGDDGVCTSFLMFEERPIPEPMLALRQFGRSPAPLRMRVRNKDGAITEEHVIFP
jgi:hypothetical protein